MVSNQERGAKFENYVVDLIHKGLFPDFELTNYIKNDNRSLSKTKNGNYIQRSYKTFDGNVKFVDMHLQLVQDPKSFPKSKTRHPKIILECKNFYREYVSPGEIQKIMQQILCYENRTNLRANWLIIVLPNSMSEDVLCRFKEMGAKYGVGILTLPVYERKNNRRLEIVRDTFSGRLAEKFGRNVNSIRNSMRWVNIPKMRLYNDKYSQKSEKGFKDFEKISSHRLKVFNSLFNIQSTFKQVLIHVNYESLPDYVDPYCGVCETILIPKDVDGGLGMFCDDCVEFKTKGIEDPSYISKVFFTQNIETIIYKAKSKSVHCVDCKKQITVGWNWDAQSLKFGKSPPSIFRCNKCNDIGFEGYEL
ncbi:MAG: hypothetical protein INQ03_09220 [Candidatus Heimdallarchaeota archaeon]|nr:hypothetical protein [Candidatus Heimdallarchaeota archaeon]